MKEKQTELQISNCFKSLSQSTDISSKENNITRSTSPEELERILNDGAFGIEKPTYNKELENSYFLNLQAKEEFFFELKYLLHFDGCTEIYEVFFRLTAENNTKKVPKFHSALFSLSEYQKNLLFDSVDELRNSENITKEILQGKFSETYRFHGVSLLKYGREQDVAHAYKKKEKLRKLNNDELKLLLNHYMEFFYAQND